MRFTPLLALAAASVAVAQTPPAAPRTPKPSVTPTPRVWPKARLFAPDDFVPPAQEPWQVLGQDFGRLWELPPLPPLDLQLDLATLENQWSVNIDRVKELEQGMRFETPMSDVHEVQNLRWDLKELETLRAPWAFGTDLGWRSLGEGDSPRGQLSRLRPDQGTPEDSLYRAAREALNRGEYSRASTMLRSLEQKFPRSRVAPAVLYWQAFALYRAGSTDELKRALGALSRCRRGRRGGHPAHPSAGGPRRPR